MKKKIVILGSTGSIGKNTLNIIRKDKKNFRIELLSTNKNISLLLKQAKEFKVKNLIINDNEKYNFVKKKYKNFNFYNSFIEIDKILKKKKIFYSMISVNGIDGLMPTIRIIKFTKNIAIANKESLICGWELIAKQLKKYDSNFIPVDSEHFSIFSLINKNDIKNVDKIYITASGGPFLNTKRKILDSVTKKQALNHPSWNMGNHISINSSSMMNKVFEVIEVKKIFNIKLKNVLILTHPQSYIHAIVKFNNGMTKILIHETDMRIPIYNSIYFDRQKYFDLKKINLKILNNPKLKKINHIKFPLVQILNNIPDNESLYETVLVCINDFFVNKFLNDQIKYYEMLKLIYKYCNNKHFLKYKKIPVKNVNDIYKLKNYVDLKLNELDI